MPKHSYETTHAESATDPTPTPQTLGEILKQTIPATLGAQAAQIQTGHCRRVQFSVPRQPGVPPITGGIDLIVELAAPSNPANAVTVNFVLLGIAPIAVAPLANYLGSVDGPSGPILVYSDVLTT